MNNAFEQKIMSLTSKLRCSEEEKQDIQMELRDHLYSAYEHYITQSYSESEAITLAIEQLGQNDVLAMHFQEVVNPIYGKLKKYMLYLFYIYSIIVVWKLFIVRLLVRVIDYIKATEPYSLKFVYSNSRLWETKQFFDFTLWERNINVIPLEMIIFYMKGERINVDIAINNLLGNFIILLPLGFYLPLLFKSCHKFLNVVAAAFYTSLIIECLQFGLQIGMADIDDVILNTIGAIVGYFLNIGIKTLYSYQLNRKQISATNNKEIR